MLHAFYAMWTGGQGELRGTVWATATCTTTTSVDSPLCTQYTDALQSPSLSTVFHKGEQLSIFLTSGPFVLIRFHTESPCLGQFAKKMLWVTGLFDSLSSPLPPHPNSDMLGLKKAKEGHRCSVGFEYVIMFDRPSGWVCMV